MPARGSLIPGSPSHLSIKATSGSAKTPDSRDNCGLGANGFRLPHFAGLVTRLRGSREEIAAARERRPLPIYSPRKIPVSRTPYGNAVRGRWCSREHAPEDPPGEMPGKRPSYERSRLSAASGSMEERESNRTATLFQKEEPRAQ